MGNSIYLGGGIKSAFCGGNVKEIWQGSNKIFGGSDVYDGWVTIGTNSYPYKRIGNLDWICTDIYERFGDYTQNPLIPDEKLFPVGLYYKRSDVLTPSLLMTEDFKSLCGNWRIPLVEDWDDLVTACGGTDVAGASLSIGGYDWDVFNHSLYGVGTNEFNFNACRTQSLVGSGWTGNNVFVAICSTRNTQKISEKPLKYVYIFGNSPVFGKSAETGYAPTWKYPVRLCRGTLPSQPRENIVKIGGRDYEYVKIGDRYWLTENLKFVDETYSKGNDFVFAMGYDDDIYNDDAVLWRTNKFSDSNGNLTTEGQAFLNKLNMPSGWRFCTGADIDNLMLSTSTPDKTWNSWVSQKDGGNDQYKMNCRLSGYYSTSMGYRQTGNYNFLWSPCSNVDGIYSVQIGKTTSVHTYTDPYTSGVFFPISICKDVE